MKSTSVSELLKGEQLLQEINIKGWVRTFRAKRFIALNDGSTINNIQCVVDFENTNEDILKRITTGAAVSLTGTLVESQGKGQKFEIEVTAIEILGDSDPETYPIQPKKHSLEFLRENAHLRTRTNTFSAVMRLRSAMSFAIHQYFNQNGFYYMHTPIITGSDAEGAGEIFQVTNLDVKNAPLNDEGEIDYTKDFFGKETNLTVSGQLEAETYAMSLGKVYTFGPTFRAENSNTSRHLAEFWMIEPEITYINLDELMDLAENYLKYCVEGVLSMNKEEIELFDKFLSKGLLDKLKKCVNEKFTRISYTEAVNLYNKKNKHKIKWGDDLSSEVEKYLCEKVFNNTTIIYNYPKEIKAFYMKNNEDDKTVQAFDILVPGIGEIIGGSIREENYEVLKQKITDNNISLDSLKWYLELRKFGTCPHGGFGLGFERLIMLVTGISNIKDVIPFPRYPNHCNC
jgi:asparaginyl-tRNA synthetase